MQAILRFGKCEVNQDRTFGAIVFRTDENASTYAVRTRLIAMTTSKPAVAATHAA